MNGSNTFGIKGKIAKKYSQFIQGMWCNSDKVFSPNSIKSTLSIFHPTFLGYSQQQDDYEFFKFFVERLQEDLNRIEKKADIDEVNSNSRPDK